MNGLPQQVQDLISAFSCLPGVGEKTASRLVVYLLGDDSGLAARISAGLSSLKSKTGWCQVCYGLVSVDRDLCEICGSPKRDHTQVCVVSRPMDVIVLERAGIYNGLYHVLHGSISPVDGINQEDLKIDELVQRVKRGIIREVILATSPGLEGDTTALFIDEQLARLDVRVTRLARGLPVGADLEYADFGTLHRAMTGRS